MIRFRKELSYSIVLLCLLFLLCSCSSNNTTGSLSNTSTPQTSGTSATSTPTAATTPAFTPTTLPTQTDCPAEGTARAVVMPPLPISSHASLVYSSAQGTNPNGKLILSKYDTVTATTTEILQTDNTILQTQLSADGQWLILYRNGQPRKIQLLRLDGKELQTLYCSNNYAMGPPSLSPDQKNLIFSEVLTNEQVLYRLELSTGKLSKVLSITHDNVTASTYDPIEWISNTSIYLSQIPRSGVGGRTPWFGFPYRWDLFFLKDIMQDVSQQSTNLEKVTLKRDNCSDYDMQAGQKIVFNEVGTQNEDRMPNMIKLRTGSNGSDQTIYSKPEQDICYVRFINPNSLLFAAVNLKFDDRDETQISTPQPPITQQDGIWKINTDGSGLTRILPLQPGDQPVFAETGYTPWMNVSHDGKLIAISIHNNSGTKLIYGLINGGTSTTIQADNAKLIGWTGV